MPWPPPSSPAALTLAERVLAALLRGFSDALKVVQAVPH